MLRYLLHLTALFGFSEVAVGQSSWNGNPIPVFQAGYLDNNYRIVYLLENETLISVERTNEKESGKEFLQFQAAGKKSFATLLMEVEGGHWITLKIKNRDLVRASDKETALRIYEELMSGKDSKKTILIDSKYTLCKEIYHRFKDQTEIETRLLGYSEEKGPNGERDYEKGIQVMTGNGANFPARLNVIPDAKTVYYIRSERTKTIMEKEIPKFTKSSNPQDVVLVGMYYFAQNPPQLEEASTYFNLAFDLLPSEIREIKDGPPSEVYEIQGGKYVLQEKEKLHQSFSQDPLLVIQKLLDIEQGVKESIEIRKEENKVMTTNNLVITRKVVPIPLTNKDGTTNEVVIRRRRVPVPKQSNSSQPSPKPDQIQSSTNPPQNP